VLTRFVAFILKWVCFILCVIFGYNISSIGYHCGIGTISKNEILMHKLELAISSYRTDCLELRVSLDVLIDSKDECQKGPYIREKELFDAFGNKFVYLVSNTGYELISMGSDGNWNLSIINANDS
jgi:hypothetical protein